MTEQVVCQTACLPSTRVELGADAPRGGALRPLPGPDPGGLRRLLGPSRVAGVRVRPGLPPADAADHLDVAPPACARVRCSWDLPTVRPPAATRYRCGHRRGQHDPAAARYCRAATWEPAFDRDKRRDRPNARRRRAGAGDRRLRRRDPGAALRPAAPDAAAAATAPAAGGPGGHRGCGPGRPLPRWPASGRRGPHPRWPAPAGFRRAGQLGCRGDRRGGGHHRCAGREESRSPMTDTMPDTAVPDTAVPDTMTDTAVPDTMTDTAVPDTVPDTAVPDTAVT